MHFGFKVDEDGKIVTEKRVRCLVSGCGKTVACSGNTMNLCQNLQIWHPELLQARGGKDKAGPSKQSTIKEFTKKPKTKLPSGGKRSQVITRELAEFVVRDLRPIALVEGRGFLKFVDTLEPAYSVPSRKTVMKELEVMEREVRACIVEELRRAQYVSLTTHFWTSLANDSYFGCDGTCGYP